MNIYIAAIVMVLNILDGWSTARFLNKGGGEANPIMRRAFNLIGFWPTIGAKTLLLGVISLIGPPLLGITMMIVYGFIIIRNIQVYDNR